MGVVGGRAERGVVSDGLLSAAVTRILQALEIKG